MHRTEEQMSRKDKIYIILIGLQTFFIGLGIIIALFQLNKMTTQMKADFAYKIDRDLLKWLNDHKGFKNWIYYERNALLEPNYKKWELDDFLGYYELLATLEDQGLVDKDVVYALFSYDLMAVYEAHDFELKKIITKIRTEEGDPDIYSGVEDLYKEMKNIYEESRGNGQTGPL